MKQSAGLIMKILALEFSSDQRSVAVAADGVVRGPPLKPRRARRGRLR